MKINDTLLNRIKQYIPDDLYCELVNRFTRHDEQMSKCITMLHATQQINQQLQGRLLMIEDITANLKDNNFLVHSQIEEVEKELKGGI